MAFSTERIHVVVGPLLEASGFVNNQLSLGVVCFVSIIHVKEVVGQSPQNTLSVLLSMPTLLPRNRRLKTPFPPCHTG